MRIANNIMAMNTHRSYTANNDKVSQSAEKLSSGYRINKAGDDAAGLAISEKMRSQIRGLDMATRNSQDAISLIQTAEGALQEVHSMLQRMNELAVQSATGTNEEFDRTQIAKEFDQLKKEINDIAEQTTFNNMKLLDGSLSNEGVQRSEQTTGLFVTSSPAGAAPAKSTATVSAVNGSDGTGTAAAAEMDFSGLTAKADASKSATIDVTIDVDGTTYTATVTIDDSTDIESAIGVLGAADFAEDGGSGDLSDLDGSGYTFANAGGDISFTADAVGSGTITMSAAATNVDATNFTTIESAVNGVTPTATAGVDAGTSVTAESTIALSQNPNVGDIVTAGTVSFEFVEDVSKYTGSNTAVAIGDDLAASMGNLKTAMEADTGALQTALGSQTIAVDAAGKMTISGANTDTAVAATFTAATPPAGAANYTVEFDLAKLRDGDVVTLKGATDDGTDLTYTHAEGNGMAEITAALGGEVRGTTLYFANNDAEITAELTPDPTSTTGGAAMRIQVGALENEQTNVNIKAMNTAGLGLDGIDIENQDNAGKAITAVRDAVNQVSDQRALLGATQNRLTHKISNLKVSSENLSAAESRIRDVDIASEMTQFTKSNILSQAATAMLAQANSAPQNVLSLLR